MRATIFTMVVYESSDSKNAEIEHRLEHVRQIVEAQGFEVVLNKREYEVEG